MTKLVRIVLLLSVPLALACRGGLDRPKELLARSVSSAVISSFAHMHTDPQNTVRSVVAEPIVEPEPEATVVRESQIDVVETPEVEIAEVRELEVASVDIVPARMRLDPKVLERVRMQLRVRRANEIVRCRDTRTITYEVPFATAL